MSACVLACVATAMTGANETASKGLALNEIHIRDPFILPVPEERRYYLYGTIFPLPDGPGFPVYVSRDLKTWQGPFAAFRRPADFWADRDFWAPEVHRHKGRYYMFASFKADGRRRGTQVLVADTPRGPFRPHSDGPLTPRHWECLDGTLFIDDESKPWMVFCHEWVQVKDGEVCAVLLSPDLDKAIGDPLLLFRASEAPWIRQFSGERSGLVTDGPYLHWASTGELLMLWSSFGERGYTLGVARAASGKITGPWKQDPEPLFEDDGGHGMLFEDLTGELTLSIHKPNKSPHERPLLLSVEEKDGQLSCTPKSLR